MNTHISETLQALRAEVEAIATLQSAMNRIAQAVEPESLSVWDGPRPDEVDDIADDDGSFSREAVNELRTRAGKALSARYKEVERVVLGRAALESLLRSTLSTGTGGVVTQEGPPPADVLNALARSGAIRLDWAQAAAAQVREVLEGREETTSPASPRAKPAVKKPAAKKAPAKKTAKKPAAKKKVAAKPKKKAAAKKAKTAPAKKRKPSGKK